MKALNADFVLKRPIGALPWGLLALLVVVFGGYQGRQAWAQHARIGVLQDESASILHKLELAKQGRRDAVALQSIRPLYVADAAVVAKMAAFPLAQILSSIESAQVPEVKVVGLEVSASEGTARADLEFADHAALLSYLEAINAGEPQPRWVLLQAQIASTGAVANLAAITSKW
jgi:hypothetical protein